MRFLGFAFRDTFSFLFEKHIFSTSHKSREDGCSNLFGYLMTSHTRERHSKSCDGRSISHLLRFGDEHWRLTHDSIGFGHSWLSPCASTHLNPDSLLRPCNTALRFQHALIEFNGYGKVLSTTFYWYSVSKRSKVAECSNQKRLQVHY